MANFHALKALIAQKRAEATRKKEENLHRLQSEEGVIFLPKDVQIKEEEGFLNIRGTAAQLLPFTEDLKSMEGMKPGDCLVLDRYLLLVSEGEVDASREEGYFLLPPDDWLMMGCKFADAIHGHDDNPYLFDKSPFNTASLPYGICITVTDRERRNDYEDYLQWCAENPE